MKRVILVLRLGIFLLFLLKRKGLIMSQKNLLFFLLKREYLIMEIMDTFIIVFLKIEVYNKYLSKNRIL